MTYKPPPNLLKLISGKIPFNQLVTGSNPVGLTSFPHDLWLESHASIDDLADDLGPAAQLVGLQMRVALRHRR